MKKILYIFLLSAMGIYGGGCSHSAASHAEEAEAHEHGESNEVELSEAQMKAVDIQIGEISLVSLGATLKTNGELVVDPQDEALVAPLASGLVKRIVVREGEHVEAGRTVAYVENLEVVGLQQEYLAAKEEEALAKMELERQNALAKEGAGIRKNQQQAATNVQIASTKIAMLSRQLALYGISISAISNGRLATEMPVVSPISGTVAQILCPTGGFADVQTPLMKIVNNAAVYCRLNVFEKDIAQIAPSQKVELRLTNRPQVVLEGEIISLTQAISDNKSLTARVKILNSTDADLVPGMPVVGILSSESSETEALPDDAIVTAEGRCYVFAVESVEEEGGETMTHFRKVEVVTGLKERGYTQVKFLNPIESGTKFVTKNAFYLGSMTSEHGEHEH